MASGCLVLPPSRGGFEEDLLEMQFCPVHATWEKQRQQVERDASAQSLSSCPTWAHSRASRTLNQNASCQPSTNSSPSADPRHHPRALGNPLTYPSSLQNSSVRQVHVGFWSSWWHRSTLRRGRSRERTVLDRGKQTREKFITCLRSLLASTGNRHRNLRKLQQKKKKTSIWSSPLPSAHPHVKECAVLGPPAPSPLTP